MGTFSPERMQRMEAASHLYFDWMTVLAEANITEVQDLQGQYLLKCPFHADKRPSFRIRVQEHNYHCFSCNAYGTIADLMWQLSGKSLGKAQFLEQVLKRNPAMQEYLGFNSLYLDSKSLHEGFNTRRRFNPKDHIGAQMPLSVFSNRVRAVRNDWKTLVFTLTMLQEGERPEDILTRLKTAEDAKAQHSSAEVISLQALLFEEQDSD